MIQIPKKISETKKLAGYYNKNYIFESGGQKYILRIPIPNAKSMDLRIIPENIILKFLEQKSFPAPRLIYSAQKGSFVIHQFIEGKLFHDLSPEDSFIPSWIPINIAKQMKKLHRLNPKNFVPYCNHIAKSPDSYGFFQNLIASVEEIYFRYKKDYVKHFRKLKFPKDPFKLIKEKSQQLTPRQFTICHCDIHRKNLIITRESEKLVILDWELVLVTDPFYDIATHFHKMKYDPIQETLFLLHYLDQNRETTPVFMDAWEQIQIYLQLEKIKSAIVDIVRISQEFKAESSEKIRILLTEKYLNILRKAWGVWGLEPSKLLSSSEIYPVLNLDFKY